MPLRHNIHSYIWYVVRANLGHIHIILEYSGNIRRFRRICEHIQSMVCASRRAPPASPRAQRRSQKGSEMSESSSCGSDTSERITDRLTPHRQVGGLSYKLTSILSFIYKLHLYINVYCKNVEKWSSWCVVFQGYKILRDQPKYLWILYLGVWWSIWSHRRNYNHYTSHGSMSWFVFSGRARKSTM